MGCFTSGIIAVDIIFLTKFNLRHSGCSSRVPGSILSSGTINVEAAFFF